MSVDLRVASYNLHWGGLRPNGEPFDIVDACMELAADVLVVQEAWWPERAPSVLDELAAVGGYTLYEHPIALDIPRRGPRAPGRGARGNWGVAVFSRVPILGARRLALGEVPGDPVRGRTAVRLQLNLEGRPVDLVAAHISARTVYGPILQLRALRPLLPPLGRPSIVAGDLNITPPPVRALLGDRWRPAVTGSTWPAGRLLCQVDHILVSPEWDVLAGEVLPDLGSDHRPVVATLRLP